MRITNEILGEKIKEGPFIVKTIGTNPGLKGNVCLIFLTLCGMIFSLCRNGAFPHG